jgi:hypothetical protein
MKRRNELWETLEILLRGQGRLWAHQNWAWEPKAGSRRLNITTIFAYISEMGMDSGTSGHVTRRGKTLDKEAEL